MHIDTAPADYLIRACREPIYRIFWDRQNAAIEFSTLRLALEAHGIKVETPEHWGLLAMQLRNEKVTEIVGRAAAAAASRNEARNGLHRLTLEVWSYVLNILGPARAWPVPPPPPEQPN